MAQENSTKKNFFLKAGPKAVLLIHGITGTPNEMNHLGKAMHKAGFTVMCNALPRHCGSQDDLKKVTWQEIESACVRDFQELSKEHTQVFVAGLSMGAMMAVHLAHKFPEKVSGIVALAPTLFYDGWGLSKGKILLEFGWSIPFIRNRLGIREGWPYGLKDKYLRETIHRFYKYARAKNPDYKDLTLFGSPYFPLACLYQHHQFVKLVKKEIPLVKTPILLIHAREDDMVSLKNSQYVYGHIGSSDKSLVILEDSYHMITIDQEKEKVIQESINFLNRFNYGI
ncbi:MAG: alpha/beta fold hydrolase [Candidatus Omnitrophica bacterium]|nr:alpha/beta fold hydrolase [Candidatus Omnitrophota bacterium]